MQFFLLVVYELCMHAFRPTGVWAADVRKPLLRLASGAFVLSVLIALLSHPPFRSHALMRWRIDLFFDVFDALSLSAMLVLSSIAGLPWKTHASRIVQVLCAGSIYSLLIQVATMSVSLPRLERIYRPLMCIRLTLDLAGVIYWLFTLWPDEPAPQPLPDHMHKQIYTLQQQVENDLTRIRSWRSS